MAQFPGFNMELGMGCEDGTLELIHKFLVEKGDLFHQLILYTHMHYVILGHNFHN